MSIFNDIKNRINNGNKRLQHGEEIKSSEILYLTKIIELVKSHDINLIGFFPPYAPLANKKMLVSNNYLNQEKSKKLIRALFQENNMHFFDFTYIKEFDNNFFRDGFHGNANIYYYILSAFSEKTDAFIINKHYENGFFLNNNELQILKERINYNN